MGGGGGPDHNGPDQSQPGSGGADDGVPPEEEDDLLPNGEPCIFQERVTLASPKSGPLSAVSVGDILAVEQQQGSVVLLNHGGAVVGSIAEPWVPELKECMDAGHNYKAEVLSIQGANCRVLLRNR